MKVMLGVTKTMFLMPDIPEGDVWQSQSGNKVRICSYGGGSTRGVRGQGM